MSKYLGFIHYIMFDKIKFQESVVREVLEVAKQKGYNNIVDEVNELGIIEDGELEDIIDSDNIHGWIQVRVELVESRFAKAVSLLLKENQENINDINGLLYKLGSKESSPVTVQEGYELISSKFLDGMPCDRAVMIIENKEDLLSFKINIDKHSNFWEKYNMTDVYWDLRDEYIRGVFDKSDYKFSKVEDYLYKIGR